MSTSVREETKFHFFVFVIFILHCAGFIEDKFVDRTQKSLIYQVSLEIHKSTDWRDWRFPEKYSKTERVTKTTRWEKHRK